MPRLFLLMLLLLPLAGNAQLSDSCHIRLTGRIMDEHDDSPLDLATIWAAEAFIGGTSGNDGQFELSGLCPGWHTLEFSHLGCEPGTARIFLSRDTAVNFYLEHHVKWLNSVTVSAQRLEGAQVQAKADLSGYELDRLRGVSLAQSIQSVAGVRMLQTGPGVAKPVIHGMHGNRISIYNNGVRQEGQEWGVDHAPEIDPFSANRIRVIKGTAALQYGLGSMGGVVLSEPAPLPTSAGLKGEALLGAQSNGMQGTAASQFEGGFGKTEGLGWRVQGSLHRGGDWKAPRYQLSNTGSAQGALSAALGYHLNRVQASAYYSFFQSEWGVLRSAHIGNVSDFLEALGRDTPIYVTPFTYAIDAPRQWTRHHLAKAEAAYRSDKWGILSLVYGFQQNDRREYDIRRAGRSARPALDMALGTHQSTLSWKPVFTKSEWHAHLGLAFQYQQNRNVPGTGVKPLIPWFNSTTTGAFGIARYHRELWELEAGIRYDFRRLLIKRFNAQDQLITEELPFGGFSGSLGLALHRSSLWTARLQAGATFRPPHVSEMYSEGLHHAVASIEQGDPALQSEKALKGIAGLELHPGRRLHIQAEAYYHYIRDYIYLEPLPEPQLTIRGVFPVFQYIQTDAVLWGVDADAEWEFVRRLSLHLKGSVLRACDLTRQAHLIYMPADRGEVELRYDLETNKKITDAHFSAGISRTAAQTRFPEEMDLLDPPGAYTLMHASASCRILLGKQAVSLFLNASNLLNTSYRDYLNRLRYYADEPGRNIEMKVKVAF